MDQLLEFADGSRERLGTFYCVGRNYTAHVKEMRADPGDAPVLFIKPPSAYLPPGTPFRIPALSHEVHYEVELVVLVGGASGRPHPEAVAVGIDLTLRDVQSVAKQRGEPWAVAKGFRGSAPLSPFVRIKDLPGTLNDLRFTLTRNTQILQFGEASHMRWGVEALISHIDSIFGLVPGDCIFTGTPEGVGPVHPGEQLTANLFAGTELLSSRQVEVC